MKHKLIIKVALAVAMIFIPSIVVADKLEIQDSTIIVLGKGQTNNNGFFTTVDSITIDSILIDEIALTYSKREKQNLSVVDSASQKTVFSHEVTNGMSKNEMRGIVFSLVVGHTYFIQHGNQLRWRLTISSPTNDEQPVSNNEEGQIPDEQTPEPSPRPDADLSWLIWLILGAIVGAGCYFLCTCLFSKKEDPVSMESSSDGESTTVIQPIIPDSVSENSNNSNNKDVNIEDLQGKAKSRLKQLKAIALSLGLKEEQIPLIGDRIAKLQELASNGVQNFVEATSKVCVEESQSQKEADFNSVQDKVSEDIIGQFGKRPIFTKPLQKAKEKWSVPDIRHYILLQDFISELEKSFRNLQNVSSFQPEPQKEPLQETSSESNTQWLNKRLRELFNFDYNDTESVRVNIEKLILAQAEEMSDNSVSSATVLSVEEAVNTAKKEWIIESEKKDSAIEELKTQLETKVGEIEGLKTQLDNKKSEINGLNTQIEEKNVEINDLNDKYNSELQARTYALVDKLHRYVDMIGWLPMLDPCDNDEGTMNQCTDIENRLKDKLKEMKERLIEFTVAKETKPDETLEAIQGALISEITIEESIVNSLCRLFAYSNLAFMTDMKREYGVRLRRKNIHEVYEALENLYIQFGIKFQVPPLFIMESKDGDYENVTGQAYSELGNLCPNVSNHCDNIDSDMKLKDIIVDIDKIGFIKDGIVQSKARILTF